MDAVIPPRMFKDLRHQLASAISDAKAYDVPSLCIRLGMPEGTEEEAYASKYKYAHRRTVELSNDEVLSAARNYLSGEEHFELSEQITKLDEFSDPLISTLTRRRIIALFDGHYLFKNMNDIDLIRLVWPIADMLPPIIGYESNLEDYIVRHYIQNDDLTKRELLEYLGIISCSRRQLEKFLVAVTSPDAQGEDWQTALLAEKIDALLRKDGYSFVTSGKISGSPYYAVKLVHLGSPSDSGISTTLSVFEPNQVHARWQAALDSRENDPERAITLSRTLLEDVCKWILHEAGETWREVDDLPLLYASLAKVLKLAPDDYTEIIFKQILGNCQSIVQSLGALRNKLGDAHSVGPRRSKPQSRHAELAVNLAGAMASFLVSTWEVRNVERDANKETKS